MKTSTLLLVGGVYLGACTMLGAVIDVPWQLVGLTCFGCIGLMIASVHEMCNFN
jgi:hypothetical protein